VDDLESAIAHIYAEPPSGFVAARAALVKELKAAKRKGDAATVASLRRPTKLAWALGEAARQAPEAAAAFFAAVSALAQPDVDLRRRTTDLRGAVSDLVRAVEHSDTAEVTAALLATAADTSATADLRLGRLAEVPAAGGFGSSLIVGDESSDAQEVRSGDEGLAEEEEAVEADGSPGEDEAAARSRNEQEARIRAAHVAALEAETGEAARAEATAIRRVEAAHAALQEAQAELAAATCALEAARRRLGVAQVRERGSRR